MSCPDSPERPTPSDLAALALLIAVSGAVIVALLLTLGLLVGLI